MKTSFFILILFLVPDLYAQTDSIERAIIYKKLLSKEIEQSEFSNIALKWNKTIKETGKYPDLPLDNSGAVHYSFFNELKDFNKEKLFYRTLEWLSINYGLIPSGLYSNLEDGKIIFSNSRNLKTGNICSYTSIISIKNEKILTEFINIAYQTFYEGHYSYDVWIPDRTVYFDINQVYPIILKKPAEWNSNLNLLKGTIELINSEIENLYNYILTYDNSYLF